MKRGFWDNLPRPILALAPMADVTDTAFRKLIAKYGKPDVTWTEFVSADGLMVPEAREKLMVDLRYTEAERPILAQLFSASPDNMHAAAALCRELGFDGIDINMGCPDRSIEKQGCGCGMIKAPENARAVIRAAKAGAGELPVSVKTRVGYSHRNELSDWIANLLSEQPVALTVHARTRQEMSKVPARWEHIREVVELRNAHSPETLVLGNGDLTNVKDAAERVAATGADGAMLGKAIFGNPWLFSATPRFHKQVKPNYSYPQGVRLSGDEPNNGPIFDPEAQYVPTVAEKLRVMVEHTTLFEQLLGGIKSFQIMKKHYKAYVSGFSGARELRAELMDAENAAEVAAIVEHYRAREGATALAT